MYLIVLCLCGAAAYVYTEGNVALLDNPGTISVEAGFYTVEMDILRNDLSGASEYVIDVTLDGVSVGGCNPDGGDYDCTFFSCPMATPDLMIYTASGEIAVNMQFQGHSWDCDCDMDTWECSKESTVADRTAMSAVGRFFLTPQGLCLREAVSVSRHC